jgi:Zn-dependent M28 family amino/carboxypeptidase
MRTIFAFLLLLSLSASAQPKTKAPAANAGRVNAQRAMGYVRDLVAFGRRAPGSEGMKKQQAYIRQKVKGDQLEEDAFTAQTPVGKFELRNLIAKYPGTTNDIIVVASHYDTNYPLKNYVGANDGGSSTAMLLELANQLRGQKRNGPAIWLVWFDGEEAFQKWSDADSLYGSRHLAEKWKADGTAKRIKAFLLLDMIGDKDLNIDWDANSTDSLRAVVEQATQNLAVRSHFFRRQTSIEDDHVPFARIGVPVVDLIDLDYGYNNVFHHTSEDTIDKLSPKSLQIVGDVVLETVRLLSK